MPPNALLVYAGAVALVVGGLGAAYQIVVPREDAPGVAMAVPSKPAMPPVKNESAPKPHDVNERVEIVPTQNSSHHNAWPIDPRHAAVPFNEAMLQLLRQAASRPEGDVTSSQVAQDPSKAEPKQAAREREPQERKARSQPPTQTTPAPEPDLTVGVRTRDAPRETARDRRAKARKARARSNATEDEDAEVAVREPSGRTVRGQRGARERARGEREAPSIDERRYDDGGRRGFFGIFNLGGGEGDRW